MNAQLGLELNGEKVEKPIFVNKYGDNVWALVKHIQHDLQYHFQIMPFPTKDDDIVIPSVWAGEAPARDNEDASIGSPPYVIVRHLDSDNGIYEGGARAEVANIGFICAINSQEAFDNPELGYHYIANMNKWVFTFLNQNRVFVGDKKTSFKWAIDDKTPIRTVNGLPKDFGVYEAVGAQAFPNWTSLIRVTYIGVTQCLPLFIDEII